MRGLVLNRRFWFVVGVVTGVLGDVLSFMRPQVAEVLWRVGFALAPIAFAGLVLFAWSNDVPHMILGVILGVSLNALAYAAIASVVLDSWKSRRRASVIVLVVVAMWVVLCVLTPT